MCVFVCLQVYACVPNCLLHPRRFDILIYSPFAAAAAAADSIKTNIAQFLLQFKSKNFTSDIFLSLLSFLFFLFFIFATFSFVYFTSIRFV